MNILWEKIQYYATHSHYREKLAIVTSTGGLRYIDLLQSCYDWIYSIQSEKMNQFLIFPNANHLDFIPAMLAAQYLGKVIVPLKNSQNDYDELFKDHSLLSLSIKSKCPPLYIDELSPSWSDPALVMLTSGSSGVAKAVAIPHRQLWGNSLDVVKNQKMNESSVVFTHLSLAHSGGLSQQSLGCLLSGGTLIIGSDSYADFKKDLNLYSDKFKITHTIILPAHLKIMPKINYKFEVVVTGSHVIRKENIVEMLSYSQEIFHVYGATEAGPFLLFNKYSNKNVEDKLSYHLKDKDLFFEEGELIVKGDLVSMGYIKHGELQEPFNGEYRTLDVFEKNGAMVTFKEKKEQLILSYGHTIKPELIEEKLKQCPYLKDFLIVGKPVSEAGEIVCLLAVSNEKNPRKGQLFSWCRENLEKHYVPRSIMFVNEIPLNSNKKPDRQILKRR